MQLHSDNFTPQDAFITPCVQIIPVSIDLRATSNTVSIVSVLGRKCHFEGTDGQS